MNFLKYPDPCSLAGQALVGLQGSLDGHGGWCEQRSSRMDVAPWTDPGVGRVAGAGTRAPLLEQLLWSPGLSVLTPASVGKNSGAVPRGGRPDLFINFSSVTP